MMKRSMRKTGFVVPFAANIGRTESKIISTSSIKDAAKLKIADKKDFKDIKSSADAEEILKLIIDDSDVQDEEQAPSIKDPVKSVNLPYPLPPKPTSSGCKRTFSETLGNKEGDCDRNTDVLSFEDISGLNNPKKEPVLPSDTKHYAVLWCKRSMKKHKKWEGDGILIVKGRSAVLKDLDGKDIASAIGYKIKEVTEIQEGGKFFIGGKECEIQHQIEKDEFLNKNSSVTESKTTPPPQKKIVRKQFVRQPLGISVSGNEHKKEKLQHCRDSVALYMPEPSPSHQWYHNVNQLPVVNVKVDSFLSQHLRPHQKEGIIFLYECVLGLRNFSGNGAILGDEMGLGKTLQCIALIWMLYKQGPYGGKSVLKKALIITPSSLVKNWESEFFKWLGKGRIAIFAVGPKRKVADFINSNYTVLIISYEMYVRSAESLGSVTFDLVICDEGHRLKNTNINTSQTIIQIPTKKRILLTGTPIQNDLEELYSIVEFVNPGIFGSISSFRKMYQNPIVKSHNPDCSEEEQLVGKSKAAELSSKISSFFLRRTQNVINQFLPPKFELVVFCKPSALQSQLYQHLLESNVLQSSLLEDIPAEVGVHLQYISALRKLCNHPLLLYSPKSEDEKPFDNALLEYVHSAFPENFTYSFEQSGKLIVLMGLLSTILTQPHKERVVIVSNFTQTLDIIERECKSQAYSYMRLDGSTSSSTRLDLVEKFNSPYSEVSIFLLSSKAGGVGLNLIGASRIVLYDIDWNPATDLQAMARIWRDGQKRCVYVYRLLTTGTIEEKIYQRQVAKQGLSGSVIDLFFTFRSQFSHEELKDIFTFHENVMCLTHDLIQCNCLSHSAANFNHEPNDENRPCQLGFLKRVSKKKNTDMAKLLEWTHISSLSEVNIPNSCIENCYNQITFLFTNNVNFFNA